MDVSAASIVSVIALTVIAMPAPISGSRGPRVPTIRPDSGLQMAVIAAIGSMYSPACSAE